MREALIRHRQPLVFLCVGGASALIDVGLMKLMLLGGSGLFAATSTGFVCGLVFNFTFHARYTFGAGMNPARLARYLGLVACNYLFSLGCVHAADALFHSPVAGRLFALVLVPVLSYQAGKRWIFK